jgi:hypothetical protein
MEADPAAIGPEATPEGASASSDRRATRPSLRMKGDVFDSD